MYIQGKIKWILAVRLLKMNVKYFLVTHLYVTKKSSVITYFLYRGEVSYMTIISFSIETQVQQNNFKL